MRGWFPCTIVLAMLSGCHPRTTAPPEEQVSAQQQTQQGGEEKAPGAKPKAKGPSNAPLAPTPAKLLVPGAVEQIQDALSKNGYRHDFRRGELNEATAAAILEFQRDHGLAKTGVPDRQTLRELGLDPDELIRNPSSD